MNEIRPEWWEQVEVQLKAHTHERYVTDIQLDNAESIGCLAVHAHVMRPEVMSSLQLARFLKEHRSLFYNKSVLDMGCGCGIQGIVCRLFGASSVTFSDVCPFAVANTRENVDTLKLRNVEVVEGDLLEHVSGRFDVIVFNHPFFPGEPVPSIPVSRAMLDSGRLIQRFLEEARQRWPDRVIMPFLHMAGEVNDPGIQGPSHGWQVVSQARISVCTGLQRGAFTFYELAPS